MTPKISVIVPINNVKHYLSKSLASIVNQTLKDIEIICVNDGSTDGSIEILQEFANKDARIKILKNEAQKGQSYSRNRAIEIAQGEYLGFIDSDDWADETMFEKMYNQAQKFDSDMVMCSASVYDENLQKVVEPDKYFDLHWLNENLESRSFSHFDTKYEMLDLNVAVWNKLYKKSFLDNIKIKFAEGYIFEDLLFFFETYLQTEKVSLLKESLYFYRINRPKSTMTVNKAKILDRIDMVKATFGTLKKLPYYFEIKDKVCSWVANDLIYRFFSVDKNSQKEYFERMKKVLCEIDFSTVNPNIIENTRYHAEIGYVIKYSFDEFVNKIFNLYDEYYTKLDQKKFEYNSKKYEQQVFYETEMQKQKDYFEQNEVKISDELKKAYDIAVSNQIKEVQETNNKRINDLIEHKNYELQQQKEFFYRETDSLRQTFEHEKNALISHYECLVEKIKQEEAVDKNEKLDSQKKWFEAEIQKRIEEVDLWHNNNLQQKLEELALEKQEQFKVDLNNKIQEIELVHKEEIEKIEEKNNIYIEQAKNEVWNACVFEKDKEIESIKSYYESEILKQKQHFETEMMFKLNEKDVQFNKDTKYLKTIIKCLKKLKTLHWKLRTKLKKQEPLLKTDSKVKKPKVSVILPVYNVEKYLPQCLDSLINQTLKDIEIICVNDGSKDGSAFVLEQYRQKDPRIKIIHKRNAGTGAARNDGLRIATGECIGFVDPDDWVRENMFERLYKLLKDKDLDIAMCMPAGFDEGNQKEADFPYFVDGNFQKELDGKIFNWRDISPFNYPMCVWNKLYKKELFDKNNIDFAEGLDFEDHKVIFHTLLAAEKIYFIREKLYVYRYNRQGSILSDNNRRLIDHMEIFNIVENILKETNTYDALRMDFVKYKVHNVLYYYSMIKDEHKQEYYEKMIQCLRETKLSIEEKQALSVQYPELNNLEI